MNVKTATSPMQQLHLILLGCAVGAGAPVNKKSKKRAPGPMTARGDSLIASGEQERRMIGKRTETFRSDPEGSTPFR